VLLGLAPVVASYAPLWEGARSLGGIVARWEKGNPSVTSAAESGAATVAEVGPGKIEDAESRRSGFDGLLRGLWRISPALLIYLWATLAIAFGQGDAALRVATLWSFVALGILCFAAGLWCSWYLAWLWPPLVLRFTGPHRMLAAFIVPFSLLLTLAYATAPG